MKKHVLTISAAILLGVSFASCNYYLNSSDKNNSAESHKKVYSKAVKSVFAIYYPETINQEGVSGTGFAVNFENQIIIVTNAHVVPLKSQEYRLISSSNKQYSAKVIYSDKESDIAFLKLNEQKEISTLKLNNSYLENFIGSYVFTIGNPYDLLFSYSDGSLSNVLRQVMFGDEYDEVLLQTNIEVNPGNSGGPLLNHAGEVIGIVSSTLENTSGISLAIPTLIIEQHLNNLTKGMVGAQVVLDGEEFIVRSVEKFSPASIAGLQPDDNIISIDNNTELSLLEIKKYFEASESKSFELVVERDEKLISLTIQPKTILEFYS